MQKEAERKAAEDRVQKLRDDQAALEAEAQKRREEIRSAAN